MRRASRHSRLKPAPVQTFRLPLPARRNRLSRQFRLVHLPPVHPLRLRARQYQSSRLLALPDQSVPRGLLVCAALPDQPVQLVYRVL